MTTLLICGSREATPAMLGYARRSVTRAKANGWHLIVGDASGVDEAVIRMAIAEEVPTQVCGITAVPRHCADENWFFSYIRIQGNYLARDRAMVEKADCVLAIWNGQSRGTKYTYDYAVKCGKRAWLELP